MPQISLVVRPDNQNDYFSNYSANLGLLSESPDFGDVTFHFGGGVKIKTNKLLLLQSSRLFGELLRLECACAAWMPISHDVICPDLKPETVGMYLDMLHRGFAEAPNVEPETQVDLLKVLEIFKVDELLSKFDSIWKLAAMMNEVHADGRTPATSRASNFGEEVPDQDLSGLENSNRTFGDQNFGLSSGDELDAILPTSSSLREDPGRDGLSRKRKRSTGVGKRRKTFPASFSEARWADSDDSSEGASGSLTKFDKHADFQVEPWEEELDRLTSGRKNSSKSIAGPGTSPVEICHICGENFSSRVELAKHFKNRHRRVGNSGRLSESPDRICRLCGEKFERSAALKKHIKENHRVVQKKEVKDRLWQSVKKATAPKWAEDEHLSKWKEGTPAAVVYKNDSHVASNDLAIMIDGKDEMTEPFLNEVSSKIFEPSNGDVYLFKNVSSVTQVSRLDGYCWRNKSRRKMSASAWQVYFYAETEVRGVFHYRFAKFVAHNHETQRVAVYYKGDKTYSRFNEIVLGDCPPEERPQHEQERVHFSECYGPQHSLEDYKSLFQPS